MFGGVFLLATKEKRCKNCGVGVCGNMCTGSASALGADVLGKSSSDISGCCDYRHLFCVVAVSTLCSGGVNWVAVDAAAMQKNAKMDFEFARQ